MTSTTIIENVHIKYIISSEKIDEPVSLEFEIILNRILILDVSSYNSKHDAFHNLIFNKSIEFNTLQILLKYLSSNTLSSSPSESYCEYVVFGPLNFKIVLKINNSGNISETNPEYKMDCGFEAVTLCLDIKHYHILLMELQKMKSIQEKYSHINTLMMKHKKILKEEHDEYKTLKKKDLLDEFLTKEEKDFIFNYECNSDLVSLLQIFKYILNETGIRSSKWFESLQSTFIDKNLNRNSNDDLSQSSNDRLFVSSSTTSLNQIKYNKLVCNLAIESVTIKILEYADLDNPLLTLEVRNLKSNMNIFKKIFLEQYLKILYSIKKIKITGRINSLNQSYKILKIYDCECLEEESFKGSIIYHYIINKLTNGSSEIHIHLIFSNIILGLNYQLIEYLYSRLTMSSIKNTLKQFTLTNIHIKKKMELDITIQFLVNLSVNLIDLQEIPTRHNLLLEETTHSNFFSSNIDQQITLNENEESSQNISVLTSQVNQSINEHITEDNQLSLKYKYNINNIILYISFRKMDENKIMIFGEPDENISENNIRRHIRFPYEKIHLEDDKYSDPIFNINLKNIYLSILTENQKKSIIRDSSTYTLSFENNNINILYKLYSINSTFNLTSNIFSLRYNAGSQDMNIARTEIFHIDEIILTSNIKSKVVEDVYIKIDNLYGTVFSQLFTIIKRQMDEIFGYDSLVKHSEKNINIKNTSLPIDDVYSNMLQGIDDAIYYKLHQDVLVRTPNGQYHEAKIIWRSNLLTTVELVQSKLKFKFSTSDYLGIIPKEEIKNNVEKYDIILAKVETDECKCYRLAEVISIEASENSINKNYNKIEIRYFYNYEKKKIDGNDLFKLRRANFSYRGIGDYLFCRYLDGSYHHAIVLNRWKNKIKYGIIGKKGKVNKVIIHKISDLSSFALMSERIELDNNLIGINQILIISFIKDKYKGNIAYINNQGTLLDNNIYYYDPLVKTDTIISVLKILPQQFRCFGLGYRYLKFDSTNFSLDSLIYPYINKFNLEKKNSKLKLANTRKFIDSLFIDVVPDIEMLYVGQPVILICSNNIKNEYHAGKIISILKGEINEYKIDVLLKNSKIVPCSTKSIRIQQISLLNLNHPKIKTYLIKKVKINIGQISISFTENIDGLIKPSLKLRSSIKIKFKDLFINEMKMIAFLSFELMYFNSKSFAWEPLVNFDENIKAKESIKNIKIKYLDSSIENSLFDGKSWVLSNRSQYYEFKVVFKTLVRITITEMSLGALNFLYLSFMFKPLNNLRKSERKFVFFNDLNENVMLIPGVYFEKTKEVKIEKNATFEISQRNETLYNLKKDNFELPFVFLKLSDSPFYKTIFLKRNKKILLHLKSFNDELKNIIIDVEEIENVIEVHIINLFVIRNHVCDLNLKKFEINSEKIINDSSNNYVNNVIGLGKKIILDYSVSINDDYILFITSISDVNKVDINNLPQEIILKFNIVCQDQNTIKYIRALFSIDTEVFISSNLMKKYNIKPIRLDILPLLSISNKTRYNIEISKSNHFKKDETVSINALSQKVEILTIFFEASEAIYIKINVDDVFWKSDPIRISTLSLNSNVDLQFHEDLDPKIICPRFIIACGNYMGQFTISSIYYIHNCTSFDIFIHLLNNSNDVEESIKYKSGKITPFYPNNNLNKAKISVADSIMSDEEFTLTEFNTFYDILCRSKACKELYYYFTVSFLIEPKYYYINIKIVESFFFENDTSQNIHIGTSCLINEEWIELKANQNTNLKIPIQRIPCNLYYTLDNDKKVEKISFHLDHNINRKFIVNYNNKKIRFHIYRTHNHPAQFIKISYIKGLTENIFINYTNLKVNFTDTENITINEKNQLYFTFEKDEAKNKLKEFSFSENGIKYNKKIEKFENETKTIDFENTSICLICFLNSRYHVYLLTSKNHSKNFKKNYFDENFRFNLKVKFTKIELSVINTNISQELIILYLKKSKNRWAYYNNERTIKYFTKSTSKKIEDCYENYKMSNDNNLCILNLKEMINFNHMALEKKIKSFSIKRFKSYGFNMKVNFNSLFFITKFTSRFGRMSIDNPHYGSINRVMLRSKSLSYINETKKIENINCFILFFIHLSPPKINENDSYPTIIINHIKLLIDEFHINLDDSIILNIFNFMYRVELEIKEGNKIFSKMIDETLMDAINYNKVVYVLQDAYFSNIICSQSYKTNSSINEEIKNKYNSNLISSYVVSILKMSSNIPLLDFTNKKLEISCLEIKGNKKYKDLIMIFYELINHYQSKIKSKFLTFLYNHNINVFKYFNDVTPWKVEANDPGIFRFKNFLFQATLGNFATLISNLLQLLGNLMAKMSMDKNYQYKRNMFHAIRYSHPHKYIFQSCLEGMKGISLGASGIFIKPIEAHGKYRRLSYVFNGFREGLLSFFMQPIGGMCDSASYVFNTLSTITNEQNLFKLLRNERCFYYNGILKKYYKKDSNYFAKYMKIVINSSVLSNNMFINYYKIKNGSLILTDSSLILIKKKNFLNIDDFTIYSILSIKSIQKDIKSITIGFTKDSKDFFINIKMKREKEFSNFCEQLQNNFKLEFKESKH